MATIKRTMECDGREHEQVLQVSFEVETDDYERSHGHRPRGFGSWAFDIRRVRPAAASTTQFWVHQSRYGDALKKAKAEALRLVEQDPPYMRRGRIVMQIEVCT